MSRWLFRADAREFIVYARDGWEACIKFGKWRHVWLPGIKHEFHGYIE